MNLLLKRLHGVLSAIVHPGYGACGRCWRNWAVVEHHNTHYSGGQGCFPLCEDCWGDLTPEERLPYYRAMYDDWLKTPSAGLPAFQEIKDAVLSGK